MNNLNGMNLQQILQALQQSTSAPPTMTPPTMTPPPTPNMWQQGGGAPGGSSMANGVNQMGNFAGFLQNPTLANAGTAMGGSPAAMNKIGGLFGGASPQAMAPDALGVPGGALGASGMGASAPSSMAAKAPGGGTSLLSILGL